jgi:hypothetical protein
MRFRRWLFIFAVICSAPPLAHSADLARIDRKIGVEPSYLTKPKYALLAFGPEARFRVWLVLDGNVLYVDKNGDGNLTAAEERIVSPKEREEGVFKVGEITVGSQVYTDLTVRTEKLKNQSYQADLACYRKLIAADPEALSYYVGVGVPVSRAVVDEKGRPVTHIWHLASDDANGFLQFADKPADAPVIHFGGPWAVWPRNGQKFVLGRTEEFTTFIGTPGHGPGTFAITLQHTVGSDLAYYVPKSAQPVLEVELPTKDGKLTVERYVLKERC